MLHGIESYIDRLDDAFHGNPWFGDSVLKTLESAIESDLNFSLPNGNSIGQILQHIINWRRLTIQKVKGNAGFNIELNSKDDWDRSKEYSREGYLKLIEELKSSHNELIFLLRKKTEKDWLEKHVPGREYSYSFLINGIVQHDIYHAGQIAILKNMTNQG